jgi:RNA polymerase sigma factor (sigma-70 family)
MSSTPLLGLVARCRTLCRPRSQAQDVELLARFARRRDAAAFEELLERYAPLVWGVCRRIVPAEADGEDAFQAVFLALVRHAGRLEGCRSLGGWLYTVAVHAARKARTRTLRQNTRASLPESATAGDIAEEAGRRELLRTVDEEIERLPVRLRAPVILCCLEGRTRDEAAEVLGCSVAALKGRLERGRNMLRRRLERRGIGLPAAFLVLSLTGERVRASLWSRTVQAALHTPPPAVAALAEAGLRASTAGKLKLTLGMLAVLLIGSAGLWGQVLTAEPTLQQPPTKAVAEPKRPEIPHVRMDRHGDPLPAGAVARLGTVRWRHGFFVSSLAYSPDGKQIAVVGAGRPITLWDAETGREVRPVSGRGQPIGVTFAPDGKTLATMARNGVISLWDGNTGQLVRELTGQQGGSSGLAFSPDGKVLATAGADGTVRLWDPATGAERRRLDCGQGQLYHLAISPDGKLLATAGVDGTIRLWDARTGEVRRRLSGHTKEVWRVAFSPDGRLLASSSEDATIRLWDPETGRQLHSRDEKLAAFGPLAFSPDGKFLASGHLDGTVHLCDAATGTEKRRWQAASIRVFTLAFSPDGKTLATGSVFGSGVRQWEVATGRERHPSEGHRGGVNLLRFSPDGAGLTSIGVDRRLLEWDLATQSPRRQFTWPIDTLIVIALSPDGTTLAAGDRGTYEVSLWDLRTGKRCRLLGKHQKVVQAVAFSPDGRLVASGGEDPFIHIWDVRDGNEIQQINGLKDRVSCLCFSPDGKTLASGTANVGAAPSERTLRLWDVAGGKERCAFDNFVSVDSVAFSPDGQTLASGYGNRGRGAEMEPLVRLWDTVTGKERCRFSENRLDVSALAFSPDGKWIASGGDESGKDDNSVHVREAATGRLIRRFEGQHSGVWSLSFSPGGLTLASGGGDSTILVWDITGRRPDGRWHAKIRTPHELETCWAALADEDAAKAYDAVWALVASPEPAVAFLRKRLSAVPSPDAKRVARLLAELDSYDFKVRSKAANELSKLGDSIVPHLRRALEAKPSLETSRRVQQLLDQARDWTADRLRDHRAVQALEHIATPEAWRLLETLAGGAPDARRTEQAKTALRHLSR